MAVYVVNLRPLRKTLSFTIVGYKNFALSVIILLWVKCSFKWHTSVNSTKQAKYIQIEFFRPLTQTLCFIVISDYSVRTLVALLLLNGYPTAVFRRISLAIIYSVYCQILLIPIAQRPFFKAAIIIQPFVANRNSLCSVPFVVFVFFPIAPIFHIAPRCF